MQSDAIKFGGAIKLSFAANTNIDPLRARVQKLIPASDGLTLSLPSTSVFGTKFEFGGAPVLYLVNDSAHSIHINQPDIDITGTILAGHVLEVKIIPASADPEVGGPFPNHWRWEDYAINTPTNAIFGDMNLTCGLYRQVRCPASDKPGTLVDLWIPVSELPTPPSEDYNIRIGSGCCYIDFSDPVSTTPRTIVDSFEEISITDADVVCDNCQSGASDPDSAFWLALPDTIHVHAEQQDPGNPFDGGVAVFDFDMTKQYFGGVWSYASGGTYGATLQCVDGLWSGSYSTIAGPYDLSFTKSGVITGSYTTDPNDGSTLVISS